MPDHAAPAPRAGDGLSPSASDSPRTGRAERRAAPPRVGEILPGVLARLGLAERLDAWRAVTEWDAIVGESLARHARALRDDRDVLVVEVEHPAVSHDLSHRKRELLDLLERRLGSRRIRDVRLILMRREERP